MAVNTLKVLVAEDDYDISEIIRYHLEQNGYKVQLAFDGIQATQIARQFLPDLIILDIMMPKRQGIEVCEILKKDTVFADTRILLLTALSDDATHIRGLQAGADDFISKPVSPKVLMSRVSALLRRYGKPENRKIELGHITINPESFEVHVGDREIILPKKEFELLNLLASRPGKIFLRNEILSRVWGNEVIVGDRTIDVHIRKIRQKLDYDCIATVKGVGYKFIAK